MYLIPIVALFLLLLTSSFTHLFEKSHLAHTLIEENQQFNNELSIKSQKALQNAFDQKEGVLEKEKITKAKNTHPSKINLYLLTQEKNLKQETLYSLTALLIRKTYNHAPFYKKDLEYRILDTYIKMVKEENCEKIDPEKIHFADTDLGWAWYRMIKGTKTYDIQKKEGYPSLLKFITYKKDSPTLLLPEASKDLLSLLFTPAIAQEIHKNEWVKEKSQDPKTLKEIETVKFVPITKEKLIIILNEEKFPIPDKNFWELVNFKST